MKKLLGVLSLGLACTMMFGCTKPTPKPEPGIDKDKILEVADFEKFSVVGNHSIVVNGEDVDNEWAIKDYNVMRAVSLNQLAAIDAALEAKVEAKGVRGLYVKEGVVLGTRDGGWTAHYKDSEGVVQDANASYALKCAGAEENDDGVWIRGTHYTSPEAHGESLTPDLLWITDNMTDQPIDGFDHDSNPVALESGVFTVVLALYKAGSELACGLGLVKTEARDPYVAPETYPVTSIEAIGEFNNWADEGTVELTKDNLTFSGKLELATGSKVKFRFNKEWKFSLGATALSTKVVTENDGDLVLDAGTYNVTITLKSVDDLKVGDELEAFSVEPEGEVIHTAVPVESMTVAGTFNGWGDLAMTKDGNTFSAVVEFAEEEKAEYQFKVKVNADWTYSFGAKYFNKAENEGNAWVEAAGKYDVSITLSEAAMTDITLDQTVTAAEVKVHEEAAVELVLDKASAGLADTALTEAKEVTLGDLVIVLEGGWMQSSKYDEIGTDSTAGTIKSKEGNTVVIEKIIIDFYKYDNYKVTAAEAEVTGTASERTGRGGTNSLVKEYAVNSASFTLEDTYTKGNSWVYQIIFVVAAAQ